MALPKPTVLVVDDEQENVEYVQRVLKGDFTVHTAENAEKALAMLQKTAYSVLLADQRMPGMSGAELLTEAARMQPGTKRLLMTGYSDMSAVVAAINLGQVDFFVSKPFKPESLRNTMSDLFRQHQEESARAAVMDEMAIRDPLTGILNHSAFQERLRQEVARARRDRTQVSLVLCSIDHFSAFNDHHGHASGDLFLREVASHLEGRAEAGLRSRVTDVVARFGPDTFAVLLPATPREGAVVRANNLLEVLRKANGYGTPIPSGSRLQMSLGVGTYPEDCNSASELVRSAQAGVARAKQEGRDRVCIRFAEISSRPVLMRTLEAALPKLEARVRQSQLLCLVSLKIRTLGRERIHPHPEGHRRRDAFENVTLDAVANPQLFEETEVAALVADEDRLLLFLTPARGISQFGSGFLHEKADRLCEAVERALRKRSEGEILRVVGAVTAESFNGRFSVQQQVLRMRDATDHQLEASNQLRRSRDRLEIQRILLNQEIHSYIQPISSNSPRRVIGHEILSRGPENSYLRSPAALLDMAEDVGLTAELDLCLIHASLLAARQLVGQGKIFINTLPSTLLDFKFVKQELKEILELRQLPPDSLIFEISEREEMSNVGALLDGLKAVRSLGIAVALDDLGTRNANLAEIATFRPDWLKLDRSLVTGLHQDTLKQDLIRAIADFGTRQNAHVLAEGIEERAELSTLETLGVNYFQGYYLGPPRPMGPQWEPLTTAMQLPPLEEKRKD